MRVEYKAQVWIACTVEEDIKEEDVLKELKKGKLFSNIYLDHSGVLWETEELVPTEDNNGEPTVLFFSKDDEKPSWTN